MVQQLKKDIGLNRRFFLLQAGIQLVCFLVGLGVALVIMLGEEPDSWFCMGTLFSWLVLMIMSYFGESITYPREFMLALSMGRTRKGFMGAYYLRSVLQLLTGWVVVLALHRVELAVYQHLFHQCSREADMGVLLELRVLLPVVLLLPSLSMCMGALYGRYGRKGYIPFYLVWLFACFVLPRMFDDERGEGVLDQMATGLLGAIQNVPPMAWLIFGAVVLTGMAAVILRLGMQQMVR